jgi:hypothetical protein
MASKRSVPTQATPDNGTATEFPFGANAEPAEPTPASANGTAPDAAPDPFDPGALRLSPDTTDNLGVKKVLLTVPVRKPDKSWFVRVHPDPDYRLQTAVIELKEDRELYLVAPALRQELAAEATFKLKMLATAINRQGVPFLWEVNLPRSDGRKDEWARTALAAVEQATHAWVRVTANLSSGGYELLRATGPLPEPEWPELLFRDLLQIAFKDRYIDTLDHPVLRQLRGEV